MAKDPLASLGGYPEDLVSKVRDLWQRGELAERVAARYPERHHVTTNRQLYAYVNDLRQRHMKTASGVAKVEYDERLMAVEHALGLHTFASHAHGGRLRAKSGIRIAGVFREAPPEFLRMIVIHELAHLREREHDKAFYRLCESIEPEYHQLELDTRLWLIARTPAPQ